MNYPSELKIGNRTFSIHYETALKATSSVRIKKNGIYMRLSRFSRGRQRDQIIEKFIKWATKKLQKTANNSLIEPEYRDGGRICMHNKIYELSVNSEAQKNAKSSLKNGYLIEISLPNELSESKKTKKTKFLAEKIIMKDQIKYLEETLTELNELHFKAKYNKCRLKRSNSRFGSCSNKRSINIAYRLLFAPREVFRYVCAHELAHLKVFNHSNGFWLQVAQAIPDYKEHEKWLRKHGFMLG